MKRGSGAFVLAMLLGAATSTIPTSANAAQQWCAGTVANLYLSSDGTVLVWTSWRNDYLKICNVNDPVPSSVNTSVTPTVCMSWLSLLRTAIQSQRQVTTYYGEAPACASLPTYGGAPVPDYVMLR
jgi:hypothetical protein